MQYDIVKKRFLIYIVSMGKMTYEDAREYIEETGQYGSILGLETMSVLMEKLHNPQDRLKFVHIAGTNGKGSVLAMLTSVLKIAGYRVGSYSSPVVCEPCEFLRINEEPIREEAYAELVETVQYAALQTKEQIGAHPTVFEIETAMAFLYFANQHCDLVILETGLGGSLDATNIVKTTQVAILTSISIDHTTYLGKTLSQIASVKAGIIKQGSEVIMLRRECQNEEESGEFEKTICVAEEKASELSASFTLVSASDLYDCSYSLSETSFSYKQYQNVKLSMLGSYQPENAILVIEAVRKLTLCGFQITDAQIYTGLYTAKWPGRFSVICAQPLFLVDGAHNANASVRIAESIKLYLKDYDIIAIIGVFRDKDYEAICRNCLPLVKDVITIPTKGPRLLDSITLANTARKYHDRVTAADSAEEAVELSLLTANMREQETNKKQAVIAFGSLSYLGDVIHLMKDKEQIRSDLHGK